jgi:hypothetical protein
MLALQGGMREMATHDVITSSLRDLWMTPSLSYLTAAQLLVVRMFKYDSFLHEIIRNFTNENLDVYGINRIFSMV